MPDETFDYDVFLCHSPKDREVVRELAERLRGDGVRVWFPNREVTPAETEEGLERSRVLVLCMSKHALGEGWAELERQTLRFRDPLNQERSFFLLRQCYIEIPDALSRFLLFDCWGQKRLVEYVRLREGCRFATQPSTTSEEASSDVSRKIIHLDSEVMINTYAFNSEGTYVLSGGTHATLRLWDLRTARCIRVLAGHTSDVLCIAWRQGTGRAVSGGEDCAIGVWDTETGRCLKVFEGHLSTITSVALSADGKYVFSTSRDMHARLWHIDSGACIADFSLRELGIVLSSSLHGPSNRQRVICGTANGSVWLWKAETRKVSMVLACHTAGVNSVVWSPNGRRALSGSFDNTLRVWDLGNEKSVCTLEGHTGVVWNVAWSPDGKRALSGSSDRTVRLWDLESGQCLRVLAGHLSEIRTVAWSDDGHCAFSGDRTGEIRVWDLSEHVPPTASIISGADVISKENVEYTNAKVLLVGDTSAGKTGLAYRLATGEWKPSDGSTVGAWSTQWALPEVSQKDGVEREIWLWDFGGQADQRLVHQLYMDRTALILLLFDADKEDVLPGLRDWQQALKRCVNPDTVQFLVAGRTDTGFRASRSRLQAFAEEHGFQYHETSAKEGHGCQTLRDAIIQGIPWGEMERRTSPRIFKRIKDEILKLRDEGQVLLTFKELREVLRPRLAEETGFTDPVLKTVIGLLAGPGVVQELEYGTYVLLQPEWINAYAQAVIRTLRQDPSELGCLPLRSIAEGELLFQTVDRDGSVIDVKRLPETEERVVLREMERQLEERGLCLRQGAKLVFPSHCGRDRPAVEEFPSICISYAVKGYLDDLYATLVVKLADSEAFVLKQLWRDAADFDTLAGGHRMGLKLVREAAGHGEISVYFAPGVTQQEQVIFANYIHAHLEARSEEVQRLRHYVCPHCHRPKGNSQVLMEKLKERRHQARVVCDLCDQSFPLWDELERLFASNTVREAVEGMQAVDAARLDTRRKGKLLALEVMARITSADQKCFEIPLTEDEGIDVELEFTDDNRKGTGKRLYLQLKCGNSHLRKRKDGSEVFDVSEQRWVEYWLKQPCPVMLVVGTFPEEDARFAGRDKVEFANVRWMEISSVLGRLSEDGKKPVKSFDFVGERLDLTSVMRWRSLQMSQ